MSRQDKMFAKESDWKGLEKLMYKVARKKGLPKQQAQEVSKISKEKRHKFNQDIEMTKARKFDAKHNQKYN